jgi:xanthine phosphoribosyltransferase
MATSYLTVSWEDFHRDAQALAERAAEMGPYRGIVAISRGGLVPGAIVARALNIRVVETVSVVAYDQQTRGDEEALGEPLVTKLPEFAGDGEGFLIVDDLVDTGTTARVVRAMLPKARFACVYAKPSGRALADDVIKEVSQDTWIVLPWERNA